MNLKLNELLFLKQYLAENTPISILNNLSATLNGTELLSLMEKGVIEDNEVSENARKPLEVLASPTVCSRIVLKNPYCAIEKYIYRKNDSRILVENEEGEMAITVFDDDDLFVKNWEQWVGGSWVKTSDFSVNLNFSELLVFLAIVDYSRFNVLRAYLGDTSNKEMISPKVLEQELGGDRINGLVHALKKNYGIETPSPDQIKIAIESLGKKGIVEVGEGYKLLPAYKSFADNFLMPDNVLMMEAVQVIGPNEIQAANSLAFGYGLFNWMVLSFEKDSVDVFTTTSAELLSVIRDHGSCE